MKATGLRLRAFNTSSSVFILSRSLPHCKFLVSKRTHGSVDVDDAHHSQENKGEEKLNGSVRVYGKDAMKM